jgi:hypothetical protein
MGTEKDCHLLNEFLGKRRQEKSLHRHGSGRRGQHRGGGSDVRYSRDDWQPLSLLGQGRYAKGFEDGLAGSRFVAGRLNSADYALGYLAGYAQMTGQRVDWDAVKRFCNPLDRAKAGDFSLLNQKLLTGVKLSPAEGKVIAELLTGYRKRPPHAVKALHLLVRNVIIGTHVVRTADIEGRETGRKNGRKFDPEHFPKGAIKFAVANAKETFKLSERTVRNAHREFLDNKDRRWLI